MEGGQALGQMGIHADRPEAVAGFHQEAFTRMATGWYGSPTGLRKLRGRPAPARWRQLPAGLSHRQVVEVEGVRRLGQAALGCVKTGWVVEVPGQRSGDSPMPPQPSATKQVAGVVASLAPMEVRSGTMAL